MDYIDSHVHCNEQSLEDYLESINRRVKRAVMFPDVAEIYERKMDFQDNEAWREKRKRANEYILSLSNQNNFRVYPFFFVWNDFPVEQLEGYKGIKWHRHNDEPFYDYNSEKCEKFIEEIQKRDLPVILEEEFYNTLVFIKERAPKAKVIIPHLGILNGGYKNLKKVGIWEIENVYTDTSLADEFVIEDYLKKYGYEKIMFGSDFPFGDPKEELKKVLNLNTSEKAKEKITSLNILGLLGED